jgi:predicted glycoside hydrolase/deacetylase ChbG (UPF0249 family)
MELNQVQSEGATSRPEGVLILNADDWGRDHKNTQCIFECIQVGTVSSTSAMVFMEDSERAAGLARENEIDAGLHLNLTTPFTTKNCPAAVADRQRKLVSFLTRFSMAQAFFHPGLVSEFEYVVKAQLEEFERLYQAAPKRIDGHHHMHLCTNVVYQELLPAGTVVRRNFSFRRGEKSFVNRMYRNVLDRRMAKRHKMVDYLFLLPPFEPGERLERIRSLSRDFTVEVETHPINSDEYAFLTKGEANRWAGDIPIARRFDLPALSGSQN